MVERCAVNWSEVESLWSEVYSQVVKPKYKAGVR